MMLSCHRQAADKRYNAVEALYVIFVYTDNSVTAHFVYNDNYAIIWTDEQFSCPRVIDCISSGAESLTLNSVLLRGRLKVEIPLSAVTESRPKVTYHIRPKPYVPPKVKRDFRPKTETESQSYLSRHASKSRPVSVAQLSRASDIFHI